MTYNSTFFAISLWKKCYLVRLWTVKSHSGFVKNLLWLFPRVNLMKKLRRGVDPKQLLRPKALLYISVPEHLLCVVWFVWFDLEIFADLPAAWRLEELSGASLIDNCIIQTQAVGALQSDSFGMFVWRSYWWPCHHEIAGGILSSRTVLWPCTRRWLFKFDSSRFWVQHASRSAHCASLRRRGKFESFTNEHTIVTKGTKFPARVHTQACDRADALMPKKIVILSSDLMWA